jgi:hypothetical protein
MKCNPFGYPSLVNDSNIIFGFILLIYPLKSLKSRTSYFVLFFWIIKGNFYLHNSQVKFDLILFIKYNELKIFAK